MTNKPFFLHLDQLNISPRISKTTIAMEKQGNKVHIGLAFCTVHDQFCRATGRQKALGRMRGHAQEHYYSVSSTDELPDFLKVQPVIKLINNIFNYVPPKEDAQ